MITLRALESHYKPILSTPLILNRNFAKNIYLIDIDQKYWYSLIEYTLDIQKLRDRDLAMTDAVIASWDLNDL